MENQENKTKKFYVDDHRNTKLHFAAARGQLEAVKALIQSGHKIDIHNYLEWTPLMMATRNGHLDVTRKLLEHRADATQRNSFGVSVFHVAVASGNFDIVKEVLDHLLCGGVSKQSMEHFLSPLTVAILFNNEHIFKYLLHKSFKVDTPSLELGLTPMMFAGNNPNKFFTNLLISFGSSTEAKNITHEDSADDIIAKRKQIPAELPCLQHPDVPNFTIVSPQVTNYFPMDSHDHQFRRSSNFQSPIFFLSPNISPITPQPYNQQLFFPPTFSPRQFLSPHNFSSQSEAFNTRVTDTIIFSPMPTVITNSPTCYMQTDNGFLWPVDPQNSYAQ